MIIIISMIIIIVIMIMIFIIIITFGQLSWLFMSDISNYGTSRSFSAIVELLNVGLSRDLSWPGCANCCLRSKQTIFHSQSRSFACKRNSTLLAVNIMYSAGCVQ